MITNNDKLRVLIINDMVIFPNNEVRVINNYFIKEFTIFSDHDQNPFLRDTL